jgi:RNA methyltransferase, RsmD family
MGGIYILRVIAGDARGQKIKTLKSMATRPTTDRVKESMFNIIAPYIYESVVLDLFAGSGSLGIEALSRGAQSALFADISKESCDIIRENLKLTSFLDKSEVLLGSYDIILRRLIEKDKKFDIIILDPPYNKNFIQETLKIMTNNDIIRDDGILIAEHHEKDTLPETAGRLYLEKSRKYGETLLSVYKKGKVSEPLKNG